MTYAPLTLADIWHAIQSRLMIVIVATLVVAIPAGLYAVFTPPVYRSNVLMSAVDNSKDLNGLGSSLGGLGGLASLTGLNLDAGNEKDEAIAVLKSRFFTEKFVNDQNLMPLFFRDKWDNARNSWRSDDPDDIPTMWDAYRIFDREIRSVDEDSKTGLIRLTIDWEDREQAAQWANLLVHSLNEHMRSIAMAESEKSITFLNKALEKTSVVELRNVIYQLIEKQVRAITLANVREEYAFRVLDPAVAADDDQYIWPKEVLIVFLGLLIGLMFGISLAILLYFSSLKSSSVEDE